jgi:hypothetical protein
VKCHKKFRNVGISWSSCLEWDAEGTRVCRCGWRLISGPQWKVQLRGAGADNATLLCSWHGVAKYPSNVHTSNTVSYNVAMVRRGRKFRSDSHRYSVVQWFAFWSVFLLSLGRIPGYHNRVFVWLSSNKWWNILKRILLSLPFQIFV